VLSLVSHASPQHLRPTCHHMENHHQVDQMAVDSLKGMTSSDWLIWPEIGLLNMMSHPGPKMTSSPPLVGILQDSGLLDDIMSGSPPADRPAVDQVRSSPQS